MLLPHYIAVPPQLWEEDWKDHKRNTVDIVVHNRSDYSVLSDLPILDIQPINRPISLKRSGDGGYTEQHNA